MSKIKPVKSASQIAKNITKALMTNSRGDVADRLVLMQENGIGHSRDIGGRCRGSVADIIEDYLNSVIIRPVPKARKTCKRK